MKNKFVKVVVIIAILFFPLKWFLFTPIYNYYLSSGIQQIDKEQFFSIVNQIKGCEAGDNIYTSIDCHNMFDTVHAKAGVSFSTKNSQYFFIENGGEPIWKSCLYKVNGLVKELVSLPGNCHTWTRFRVGASDDSDNLVVYQSGYGTYQYLVRDDGKIFSYLEPDSIN